MLNNLGTRKKALILGSVVVVLGGGGLFGFKQYDKQQHELAEKELATKQADMSNVQKEIDSFLLKDGYLSKNVSSESLDKNKLTLKQLKNFSKSDYVDEKEFKSLKKEVTNVEKQLIQINLKFGKQKQVNELFDKEVMVANEVKTDGIVKEDVEAVKVDLSEFKDEDSWLKDIKKEVEIVKDQIKVKLEVTKSVESFFSQDKVKEGVTRKQYDETIKKVNNVKNKSVQDELKEKLSKVDDELKKIDKIAKEKVEKEAKENGGTVKKKEDGSYVVVPPKQEVSNNSGSVALTGGTNDTQSYSGNEGSSYSAPATNSNSYSGGGSSNNYSSSNGNYSSPSSSASGGQSSGGGSVAPSNGGSQSSGGGKREIEYYEDYNPNNGGTWHGSSGYGSLDEIPGLEFVTGE